MMRKLFLLTVLMPIFFNGCDNGKNEKNPPAISLGRDPCDYCYMLINEKKFSASLWLENGEAKRFDDIGCMIDFKKRFNGKVKSYWVYDFNSNESIRAEEAFFVRSTNIVSPMAFGIVAFKTKNEALNFSNRNSAIVDSFNNIKIND